MPGNSLKKVLPKTRLILHPHPPITTKKHKEVSNLEPSYIAEYMKRTFQNCSFSNDETLPLTWQNFSCYSVRALETRPGLLQSHKTSALGCWEGLVTGMDRGLQQAGCSGAQVWISWAGEWEKLTGKAALPPPPFSRNERGIYVSHRGAAFCTADQVSHIMYYSTVTYLRIQ